MILCCHFLCNQAALSHEGRAVKYLSVTNPNSNLSFFFFSPKILSGSFPQGTRAWEGIFTNDPSDNFHHESPAPTSVKPGLLGPHGLDVKIDPVWWLLQIYQEERTWDACPLSVSKHGLHSWISAYLCLSAFASIHGSVPNSNSKLSKRSYLAAPCFIQHMDDKNTHIESLPARPVSHSTILPLCLFANTLFRLTFLLYRPSGNYQFRIPTESLQGVGLLSFIKKDTVRVPGSSSLNIVTIRCMGGPRHVQWMNECIKEWLSKWMALYVHKQIQNYLFN